MAAADSPLFRFQMWRGALPPALRLLLTVNVVSYLAFVVLLMLALFGVPLLSALDWLYLPARPEGVLARPWTPLTYGFVNAFGSFFGLISFLFGVYWLQWIGREYEGRYESHRLFGVYVLGALGGAAFALLLGAVLPQVPAPYYFGLWTPVTAVLCALAARRPDDQINLFLLGPVSMKWVAVGFVVLSLVFSGDLTVVGAALMGVLVARADVAGRDLSAWAKPLFGGRISRPRAPKTSQAPLRKVPTPAGRRQSGGAPPSGREPNVDDVLDKILEKGYDSLTAEERAVLDRASRD